MSNWTQSVNYELLTEARLPVIVQIGVGHGHAGAAVRDVKETIVAAICLYELRRPRKSAQKRLLVLVMVSVGREVQVVDPNIACRLDTNGITRIGQDLADLDVPDDDVRHFEDTDANTDESLRAVRAIAML